MALGSSAPEILLSVIETVTKLGECPGELGASTIVGSASFNLLVISAVSIFAVNEDNDVDPDRDETAPLGVKKINDMGVFAVTAVFSVFAYVWMWICLMDQQVTQAEAWLTLVFFFVLIGLAFAADKYKSIQDAKKEALNGVTHENKPQIEYQAVEIYRELINEMNGHTAKDESEQKKREKMKNFIKETMHTDQIDRIALQDLKQVIEGDQLVSRVKYRRQVGKAMSGKRQEVAKGQILKLEHAHAEHLDETLKNDYFGFS